MIFSAQHRTSTSFHFPPSLPPPSLPFLTLTIALYRPSDVWFAFFNFQQQRTLLHRRSFSLLKLLRLKVNYASLVHLSYPERLNGWKLLCSPLIRQAYGKQAKVSPLKQARGLQMNLLEFSRDSQITGSGEIWRLWAIFIPELPSNS